MSSIGSSARPPWSTTTGRAREAYRVQELLRTHLLADLQRRGPRRLAELHAVAARWWADQDEPVRALEHAAAGRDRALLIELLHRFAIPLILAGHHGPLRRALARVGASATATAPSDFDSDGHRSMQQELEQDHHNTETRAHQ